MDAQLYKGSLTTIILKLLADNGRMYGYEMTQAVKALTGGEVEITEGALYPALHKLESQGLLLVDTEKVKGRQRKYYRLSSKGEAEVVTKLEALVDFIRNMELILHPRKG